MKTALLAFLFGTAAMVPVYAADMPLKAPPQRIVSPVSNWSGFYLFGTAGYSEGKITPDDFNLDGTGFSNPKPKGAIFGFGGGYNYQSGRVVGGVEVDYTFSNEKQSQTLTVEDCIFPFGYVNTATLSSKIDALGSARLRLGYLLTDNILAYGTAGAGWGRSSVDLSVNIGHNNPEDVSLLNAKTNLFGWVAGGGVEIGLDFLGGLRLRAEYLHYDFGSTTHAFQTPFLVGVNLNAKTTDDVVRGALIIPFH